MKIAFTTFFYPPEFNNGAAIYAHSLCTGLAALGQDVTVFTPKLSIFLSGNSVEEFHPKEVKTTFLGFIFQLRTRVDAGEYDICHSQGGTGLLLPRIDLETLHHLPPLSPRFIQIIPSLICARRAKDVITVSKLAGSEMARRNLVSPEKIRIVANGVSDEFMRAVSREGDPNPPVIRPSYKRVLMVATEVSKRKNFPLALRTITNARRFVDTRLAVVVPRSQVSELRRLALDSGLNEFVECFSGLTVSSLAQLYRSSDLLIVPSLEEGFAIPLVEATAAGLPFLSQRVGVAPFLARHGFGFVASNDEEFLQMARGVLTSPDLHNQHGFEFVSENFSWKKAAKQTLAIYQEQDRRNG